MKWYPSPTCVRCVPSTVCWNYVKMKSYRRCVAEPSRNSGKVLHCLLAAMSVCLSLSVCLSVYLSLSVCLSVERIDVHVNSWKTIFHRNLLKTTSYLIALEKLHVLHSVETFESSNKEGLIKGIWRNHSHQKSVGVCWFLLLLQSSESYTYWYVWSPMDPFTDPSLTPSCGLQASMLVAALCLDYKVYDTQIWNGVLQQLVHFGLVRHPLLFILSWILRMKIFY